MELRTGVLNSVLRPERPEVAAARVATLEAKLVDARQTLASRKEALADIQLAILEGHEDPSALVAIKEAVLSARQHVEELEGVLDASKRLHSKQLEASQAANEAKAWEACKELQTRASEQSHKIERTIEKLRTEVNALGDTLNAAFTTAPKKDSPRISSSHVGADALESALRQQFVKAGFKWAARSHLAPQQIVRLQERIDSGVSNLLKFAPWQNSPEGGGK